MTNLTLHDFLVEHAKFPFPETLTGGTAGSTDISEVEVGLLEKQWKAVHAVRDNDLAKKLCDALESTLGQTPLTEGSKQYLLRRFLPTLLVDEHDMVDSRWLVNSNEAEVSVILVPREFKLTLWGRARRSYNSVFSRR